MEPHEKSVIVRLTVLESRIKRIESDIESEKRTRANANALINAKLDKQSEHMSKQDKIVYIGLGIVGALQFLAPYVIKR